MQRIVALIKFYFMKKTLFYLIFTTISFCSLAQWKIENYDDGFQKDQSIHTNFYFHKEAGCINPTFLALSRNSLFIVTDCLTGSKSKIWTIDIIFTVDNQEKKYSYFAFGGWEYRIKLLKGNYLLELDGFLKNEVLETFLQATNIKLKATCSGYDPIFFKMTLNPSNTEQAWDANTGGKYLTEKKAKQEEIERTKKEEENRIKLENQKKDADKTTLLKINDLISKNSLEDAAKEYSKLNFINSEMKGILQQKLEDKFGQELDQLNTYNVDDYIKANKSKLNSINPGNYKINFDKNGISSNVSFPSWSNVPKKVIASFTVKLKSETEISIVLKDSILVSSTFSTSNSKPLFIDKNENFYFKSKTGLPVAKISINPAIDKKLVRINKVYKREKYANGILIDTQEFKTEKTVGILKKDQ
jgi:hypothetical protein